MRSRGVGLVALVAVIACTFPFLGPRPAGGLGTVAAGRVHASYNPSKGKIFVLIIGSDARAGNPYRSRADALHVVGINTKSMRGGILNFPRDSWVNIPGHGYGKLNEALYDGGPALAARTLENLTGLRLDYWILTAFEGFRKLIKDVGDVRIHLGRSIYDPTGSGAHLKKGTQRLNEGESLAYVRTRHSFPGGDIDRTSNQARFLLLLLAKFKNQTERNPAALFDWLGSIGRNTRNDISAEEMFRLGVLATQASRRKIDSVTVPVSIGSVGTASVVFISPAARSIYSRFRRSASL
jgi:polyisoprenyl-teichoic acid--peptidoglycan teichoic acid transferase